MNAVNLIPSDHRRRSASVSASPLTLGLIGGLVVVLVAAVLYVFAVNDVRSRKTELARVTANAASWQAAAKSYTSYVTAAQQRRQQMADVRQLITGRFPWSLLLSQIGGVMPKDAALSNLSSASPASAATSATGSTSSTTPSTSPTVPAVQLSGCAASQSAVAATMVALRRVHGVGSVSLASTSKSATASGAGSSAGANGGGCPFPVTFQMSLQLAPATAAATSGSATPAASSASTPAGSSGTTPAPAPAASTATTSTGATQ